MVKKTSVVGHGVAVLRTWWIRLDLRRRPFLKFIAVCWTISFFVSRYLESERLDLPGFRILRPA